MNTNATKLECWGDLQYWEKHTALSAGTLHFVIGKLKVELCISGLVDIYCQCYWKAVTKPQFQKKSWDTKKKKKCNHFLLLQHPVFFQEKLILKLWNNFRKSVSLGQSSSKMLSQNRKLFCSLVSYQTVGKKDYVLLFSMQLYVESNIQPHHIWSFFSKQPARLKHFNKLQKIFVKK